MMSFTHQALLVFCSAVILVARGNLVMYGDPFQPVTKDEIVSSGGTVTLTCTVEDNDNSSLQWSNTAQQTLYFGEKRALRDNRIQLVKSTPTELSISISEVELSDEGEYTCSIFTMPVRTARATVTVLGVPQKPRILGNTDPIEDGGKLKLTCTSSGSKPPAKLRWWKDGEELEGFPSTVENDPDGRSFKVTSDLVLTVTASDNRAAIKCSVDHESIPPTEIFTEEKIEVLFKPSVLIKPLNDLPREGDRFHLECVVSGNPDLATFSWRKDSGELSDLSKQKTNILVFEALNKSDDGTYSCEARNSIGAGEGSYTLHVQDPTAMPASSSIDHAVIGGVVAVIVFILLCLLIVLGRYLIRHKGTYLTHEAKGSDDAADADTAIINAEGGQSGAEDKKEYFI